MIEHIPMTERRRRAAVKRTIAALERDYRRLCRLRSKAVRDARSWEEQNFISRNYWQRLLMIQEKRYYLEHELPPYLVYRDGFLWRVPIEQVIHERQ